MKRIKLTEKLILYFLLTGVFSILCVSWYAYYSGKKAVLSRTFAQLTSMQVVKKHQLEQHFSELSHKAESYLGAVELAQAYRVIQAGSEQPVTLPAGFSRDFKQTFLGQSILFNANIVSISLMARSGYFVQMTKTPSPSGPDLQCQLLKISGNQIIENAIALAWTRNRALIETGNKDELLLLVSDPLAGRCILLHVAMPPLYALLVENKPETGWGSSGESYIVNDDMYLRSPSRFITDAVLKTEVQTAAVLQGLEGKRGNEIIEDYRGVRVLSAYSPLELPGKRWVLLVEIDLAEAMAPVNQLRNEILFLSIFIGMFVFLLAWFLARSVSKPILKLKTAARQISQGDYSIEVSVDQQDEIGDLANAFQEMAGKIRQQARARIDGQDMERQRLSMELHDGLGQRLVAARYRLESTDCSSPEKTRLKIEETKQMVDHILEEIRRISNNLMPGVLREFGLEVAVQSLCREINLFGMIRVQHESQGDLSGLPADLQVYLFRIVQEALNNCVRHSASKTAQVFLSASENLVVLKISDQGKGCDEASMKQQGRQGLGNMRERAHLLGGNMQINSAPGEGTVLQFHIPIDNKHHDQHYHRG